MYADCMFCEKPLGANEVVETFPVGRRLAFDAARGRLWVVCRRCERWNLTPLEERWEAVEVCERLFRDTRLRVSTENMGLARHAEGLELVRIGQPLRPEFAAWRYGDQFGRRRKKAILYGVAAGAVITTVAVGGIVTGAIGGGLLAQSGNFVNLWRNGRVLVRLRTEDGELLKLRRPEIEKARIQPDSDGGWAMTLKTRRRGVDVFRGPEAERVAGLLMPQVNSSGGKRERVQDAVGLIEAAGHPEAFIEEVVRRTGAGEIPTGRLQKGVGGLPVTTKLAFEMALHEERERRALEGELKGLEIIWRREEEVAAIADDLLLPESARARLDAMTTSAASGEEGAA